MESIPIIDLDKITRDNNADPLKRDGHWTEIGDQIRNALHQVGFMYLINHRIPSILINSAFNASAEFFCMKEEIKEKYKKIPVVTNHGWIKAGQELLHPNSVFELREGFDFVSGDGRPIQESPNFCPTMDQFKKECETFMKKFLLPLLSTSLGIDQRDFFNKCCTHLDDATVGNECDLRVIYYPPVPNATEIPAGAIRTAEHTDYELCTLLFQDDVGGLEVKSSSGKWISAKPIPGSILVNTGDLLELWTSGYFPATKHRVIIPEEEIDKRIPRYSFAYFFAPDNETIVAPLKARSTVLQNLSPEDAMRLRDEKTEPVTAYEHIMARVKEAYQY